MQMEAMKFFRSTQTKAFSGSLGRNKIEGTLSINQRTRTVAFVNKSNSKCRTIIKMSDKQLCGLQTASASSNSKKVQDGVGSKAEISRTFCRESSMITTLNEDDCTKSELVPEGTQRIIITPSGNIISSIPRGGQNDLPGKPSKFGPGSKARGAAKRDFAQQQAGKTPTSRQSGGGFFADAFPVRPQYPGRPGGLEPFGRVTPKLAPNQGNPGGGDVPRSSTTLSSKPSQSEYQPDG
jgi:hypothetical protein